MVEDAIKTQARTTNFFRELKKFTIKKYKTTYSNQKARKSWIVFPLSRDQITLNPAQRVNKRRGNDRGDFQCNVIRRLKSNQAVIITAP
ncbi:MAG: hypothetical protein KKE17_01460 [Proteobacteria bacterium]|nr:hypothetical protein [Pseudomonadota bacterium]